jgi:hypothetical protein
MFQKVQAVRFYTVRLWKGRFEVETDFLLGRIGGSLGLFLRGMIEIMSDINLPKLGDKYLFVDMV